MIARGRPAWVFRLWCEGQADMYCASDAGLPISRARRSFWRVWGAILAWLFGWWWVEAK